MGVFRPTCAALHQSPGLTLPVLITGIISGLIHVVQHLKKEHACPELIQPGFKTQQDVDVRVRGVFFDDREAMKALTVWKECRTGAPRVMAVETVEQDLY